MNILSKLYRNFFPKYLWKKELPKEKISRYKRMWVYVVLVTSVVALTPLIFMSVINNNQYQEMFKNEITAPTYRLFPMPNNCWNIILKNENLH